MMFVFSESFKSIVLGRNLAAEHTNFLRALCVIKHSQEAQLTGTTGCHTRIIGDKRDGTVGCLSPQPAQSQVAVETAG